uniref:Putative salivary cys-rich secreted peptide salivary cys-rich secreted peptide n=1 Tax=Corethrella appendiculata TaxID=1370023 RepID=U5ENZ4_9DIPT
MQNLKILFYFFATIVIVNCDVGIRQNAIHPDHPGVCYEPDLKITIEPGKSTSNHKNCQLLMCTDKFDIQYTGCGVIGVDKDCVEIGQDFTKNYPECCIKYKCKGSDGKDEFF